MVQEQGKRPREREKKTKPCVLSRLSLILDKSISRTGVQNDTKMNLNKKTNMLSTLSVVGLLPCVICFRYMLK
jgi:hypothetical protein